MNTLVKGRRQNGLELVAEIPRMPSQVVLLVRFLVEPFLDQREMVRMADLLEHFKSFRARIVQRAASKPIE